jgi:hypothetical protein
MPTNTNSNQQRQHTRPLNLGHIDASLSPLARQLRSRSSTKGCEPKRLKFHRIRIETIRTVLQHPCHDQQVASGLELLIARLQAWPLVSLAARPWQRLSSIRFLSIGTDTGSLSDCNASAAPPKKKRSSKNKKRSSKCGAPHLVLTTVSSRVDSKPNGRIASAS